MKIFVSHSHAQRDDADRLALALRAVGHTVFLDSDGLAVGGEYNQALRVELQASDLVLFLITPESVRPGSFARSEVEFARQRWPSPVGHVLAVLWKETTEHIPPYLQTTTWVRPAGNPVAETVAAVQRWAEQHHPQALPTPAPHWGKLFLAGLAMLTALAWLIWMPPDKGGPPAPTPSLCLLRATLSPAAAADALSLEAVHAGQTRSFVVQEGQALLDLEGLTGDGASWTLQVVADDGRRGPAMAISGCPTEGVDVNDGAGMVLRLEPRS